MTRLICFDMDGVIFEHLNFWFELHKAYGTYEEGKELTEKYIKTNYQKLVDEVVGRLWKGKDAKVFYKLIGKVKYNRGVKETFKELRKRKYKTAIISSGPRHLAMRAKKDLMIDYIYANNLIIRNKRIAGSRNIKNWPIRHGNKAEVLRELCRKHNIDLKDATIVCNEDNDIKMARSAGHAIAFNPITEEIKKYCNVIIKNKNLTAILKPLDEFERRESIFKMLE